MEFESYHPGINLLFFAAVIAGTLAFRQPVFLAISLAAAFVYSVKKKGRRGLVFNLCLLPPVLLFALYYGSYHHFGVTVLSHNFIGNQITLESFVYGGVLALQAAGVCMWFSCIHAVFTADKVVYLFGRVSPKASLFLAILLRTVPRLREQGRKIAVARQAIGRGMGQGNLWQRLKNTLCIAAMLLTWVLESFTSRSDAMRSRGYGLRHRTAFSIYRFDNRDRSLVIALAALLTVVGMGVLLDQTAMAFAPRLHMNRITPLSGVFYAAYLCLCLLPPVLEWVGEYRFARLRRRLNP